MSTFVWRYIRRPLPDLGLESEVGPPTPVRQPTVGEAGRTGRAGLFQEERMVAVEPQNGNGVERGRGSTQMNADTAQTIQFVLLRVCVHPLLSAAMCNAVALGA